MDSPNAQSPGRGEWLRLAMTALTVEIVDAMVADLAADSTATPSSAGSLSLSERLLLRTIRPFVPKMRELLLERVRAADPAMLEQLLGASAAAIESILAQAPGDPLPRAVFVREDGGYRLRELDGPIH